ncbi:glycosyltransferase family 2 protein [Frankia sp. Cr1]|uniref:glycosyltransferase family 2 protein n=1 Tax=Frankia sp. Cr1 TaxID=3073931 RepID=UPI002AD2F54F|nr:glycosyltransferase family 2 protein [Frankia sp. Cr1]
MVEYISGTFMGDPAPPGGANEIKTAFPSPEYQPEVSLRTGDIIVPRQSGRRRVTGAPQRWHLHHDDRAFETVRLARGSLRPTAKAWVVGVFYIAEFSRLRSRLGGEGCMSLLAQVAARAGELYRWRGVSVGQGRPGELIVVLPVRGGRSAEAAFDEIVRTVARAEFVVDGEILQVTPLPGYVVAADSVDDVNALRCARLAADVAARRLDMDPVSYQPWMERRSGGRSERRRRPRETLRLSTGGQIVISTALCLGVPFAIYTALYEVGVDPTGVAFTVLVIAMAGTALMIYLEQLAALEPRMCPDTPATPYPAATAIIAAYLPNESATILDTVRAFLRLDYPGPLRIILAYNTPRGLPIEDALALIAEREPRFVALHVPESTSKAQNVNAALSVVTGDFVGVFDADHHPAPDAFERAWRWLSHGAAVVQGHCVIRNGGASWISRLVAVEFESIYAVSHPGRAMMYEFGIFGGSNGFWRTGLLHQTRMRGSMLTEDIDASLRTVISGGLIVADPALVSYELAPTTFQALWRQRMRWAQGWMQASRRHLWKAIGSPALTLRQKLGLAWLLGWREIYPWLSPQIIPLVLFSLFHRDAGHGFRVNVSLYVLAALFSAMAGPVQALFAYALADPTIRRHRSWFVMFCLANIAYSEFKNVIARLAPVKELLREREWHVTPRDAGAQPNPAGQAGASGQVEGCGTPPRVEAGP